MWLAGSGGQLVCVVALGANALGWPADTSPTAYLYSLLYMLVYSSVVFVRVLIIRPRSESA